jgi:hypothetical protein
MNHYKWGLCNSCIQRHCNRSPKLVKGKVFDRYACRKYRKHQEGFKLEEVYYEKTAQ